MTAVDEAREHAYREARFLARTAARYVKHQATFENLSYRVDLYNEADEAYGRALDESIAASELEEASA